MHPRNKVGGFAQYVTATEVEEVSLNEENEDCLVA